MIAQNSYTTEPKQKPIDVLIITTGHHPEDGRLVRHRNALVRKGLVAEITAIEFDSRLLRYLVGPIKARKEIIRTSPKCLIIPDPELHFFLAPLLAKRFSLIADVHEDYESVALDRDWIKGPIKYVVNFFLKFLPRFRRMWADVVVVADRSISTEETILVENIPHPSDLEVNPNPEPLRLAYVGDIRVSRGIEEMLSLVKNVPSLRLDLVGPCVSSENLLNKIDVLGLNERVIWHGRKSYQESWEIASRCAIGLSLLEDTKAFKHVIPTKIWEYWALGMPVLVSNLTGQSGLIRKVGGGFVLSEDFSYVDFESLLHNSSQLISVGEKGREYFLMRSKENAEALFDAYQLAIKNS